MRLATVLLALVACHRPPPLETIATPAPGITMSFYRAGASSYTVVDDRRSVEVRGGMLLLDHVDPGAALPSLVIEPLGTSTLVVGQCDRDHETHTLAADDALAKFGQWQQRRRQRIAEGDPDPDPGPAPDGTVDVISPVVRCNASGADGPQLVRLLYVSSSLAYSAQHAVTMTSGDRATIATRFAIAAPSWGGRADVVLFEGMPGGEKPPVALARGSLALDGSTSVLGAPPREIPARVRRVYDGATRTGVGDATDPTWGRDSVHAVWVWLELDGAMLSPGPTHAHLELPGEPVRDIDVPSAGRQHAAGGTRLPLWIDDQLRGLRTRTVVGADGSSLVDRFAVSISSTAAEPREVWIEEKLRPAKRRALTAGWPTKPVLGTDIARTKVTVKAGGVARVGYAIEYVF
jgi:hypothetical protein